MIPLQETVLDILKQEVKVQSKHVKSLKKKFHYLYPTAIKV
jgi:hypothetical protein